MNLPLLRVVSKYWFKSWHTYLVTFVLPVILYFISIRALIFSKTLDIYKNLDFIDFLIN